MAHRQDEAARRFRHLASEALTVTDDRGRPTFVSPGMEGLLGYTADEWSEIAGLDALHPDDRAGEAEVWKAMLAGGQDQVVREFRARSAIGEWVWLEAISVNLIADEEIGGVVTNFRDISERRAAEDALRDSEERFRTIVQRSTDALIISNPDLTIAWVSPSVETLFGYRPEDLVGIDGVELIHPEDLEAAIEPLSAILERPGAEATVEFRVRVADGGWRWVENKSQNMVEDSHIGGILSSLRDITERKDADRTLRESEERYRTLVQQTEGAVLITDRDGRITWLNDSATETLGLSQTVVGTPTTDYIHPEDRRGVERQFASVLDDPNCSSQVEFRVWSGTEWRWYDTIFTNQLDDSSVAGVVANFRDTTERVHTEQALRDSEARLEHQATHDPLTNLPNRTLLLDRLEHAVERSARHHGTLAVMFVDLDHFKFVNDSLGHSVGDVLLNEVAERIGKAVPPGDTVARFGGDEFVLVCEELVSPREAVSIAERILQLLEDPFLLREREVFVRASIGIALAESSEADPEGLIADADAAMYQAKSRGRSRYEMFDRGMRAQMVERLDMENALRRALAHDEFEVFYQPIVSLPDRRPVAVEALLRWHHPDRGLVLPGSFIGLAEETGQIVPIGRWVTGEVCRQIREWAEVPLLCDLTVAVNLSGRQLGDEALVSDVKAAVEGSGVGASRLSFEITESVLMDDIEAGEQTLRGLRSLGVGFAIDDFGTGYSSLAYLRRLPVDVIKIDRSFVDGLGTEADDSAIVTAVVDLSRSMDLVSVAEGVETAAQVEALIQLGCDRAQGYLFAHPEPVGVVEDTLLALGDPV